MTTINDVIREASNEHEVYFLLTSYVETVRFCDKLSCLPAPVRDLPLNGVEDVRSRIGGLKAELGTSHVDDNSRVIVAEAADLFGEALNRLQWLEWERRRATAMVA
ncbi:MAG TPA: hypothetical protein VMN03_09050 [Burkholderiales bacterium]|jgi:hypothetical protein|nr:hypothetical protein [Burkholderiales bacterium]